MGREIRRVPPGWQHPKDEQGIYIPLLDMTYEEALETCLDDEDWCPEPEWYRPAFDQEPTHYQVYEDVSEGTPVSPVFATEDELLAWLIGEGHSEHAAREFIKDKWVPSMLFTGGASI